MEQHHGNHLLAAINMAISFASGFFALINMSTVQSIAGIVASCIAVISGVFAARYYYYAAKEKKQNLISKK
jgi:uncharacterized membrane protein